MPKRITALLFLLSLVLMPTALYAQGPTPTTSDGGLGSFLGSPQTATTPQAPAGSGSLAAALTQAGYAVVTSGNWYDEQGNPRSDSVFVMMLAAASDLKSTALVGQVAAAFVALRSTYPAAQAYHALLLDRSRVMDFATTANSLELLNSSLLTPDAFIKQVFDQVRIIDLVTGTLLTTGSAQQPGVPAATRTRTPAPTRVATRPAPTRTRTPAPAACPAPADKARLYIRNGYTGTMRFTIGGGEWGTHDYDIAGDGQYHFIDMPPGTYTYTAFIPGAGQSHGERKEYFAGQCYELNFQG